MNYKDKVFIEIYNGKDANIPVLSYLTSQKYMCYIKDAFLAAFPEKVDWEYGAFPEGYSLMCIYLFDTEDFLTKIQAKSIVRSIIRCIKNLYEFNTTSVSVPRNAKLAIAYDDAIMGSSFALLINRDKNEFKKFSIYLKNTFSLSLSNTYQIYKGLLNANIDFVLDKNLINEDFLQICNRISKDKYYTNNLVLDRLRAFKEQKDLCNEKHAN